MSYTDSIGCLFNCASKLSILKRKMTWCHPALLLDEIPNLQRTILIANDIWLKTIFLFCMCKLCIYISFDDGKVVVGSCNKLFLAARKNRRRDEKVFKLKRKILSTPSAFFCKSILLYSPLA